MRRKLTAAAYHIPLPTICGWEGSDTVLVADDDAALRFRQSVTADEYLIKLLELQKEREL
ncbi:MAG: hypothetical protein ABIS06_16120 [Vicinamibacterales bacterium]